MPMMGGLNLADAGVETGGAQMVASAPQRMVVVANLFCCFQRQDVVARDQDGFAG